MPSAVKKPFPWGTVIGISVLVAFVFLLRYGDEVGEALGALAGGQPVNAAAPAVPLAPPYDETPEQALARIIALKRTVNTHEHIQGPTVVKDLLTMMDKNGMKTACLMGSSRFTLTLNESVGFTDYDENNEALLKIALEMPDRFEAWPTLDPLDPEKTEKIRSLHERGATGVKLYIGHGFVRRDNGNYMFHTMAIDDPSMFPFYEYCEKNFVPLCLHVNPYLKGFAQELFHVLESFPDMKVNCPHFVLSSIKESRLMEILDTFPNVYSDISFGHDDFLTDGLKRMSKDPAKFKALFNRYPNRFFFGTDLVLTDYENKTPEWMQTRVDAYYNVLTKATYTTPLIPGETLTGLEFRGPLLDNILYKNYEDFRDLKPKGTKITRKIDWKNMGVSPIVDRAPGQAFPPEPKKPKSGVKKPFDPVKSIQQEKLSLP